MDACSNSFYSRTIGYVVDGRHFGHDVDRASNYLVREGCMGPNEALTYLNRLVRSYNTERRASV